MTLMTNKAESDEQFTQLVGGAIELRFTIGKGLVHLQMALSAMSLVDDIRDIEHVMDNPTRLLVLENTLRGLINRLGFLNLEMLGIAVSLDVLPTKILTVAASWSSDGAAARTVSSPQLVRTWMM
jgi:hypothetical protein